MLSRAYVKTLAHRQRHMSTSLVHVAIPETAEERIEIRRKKRGLTQAHLAVIVGLSRNAFIQRLRENNWTEDQVVSLAEALDCTPEFIRYGISGTFADGVRWAVRRVRETIDTLQLDSARELEAELEPGEEGPLEPPAHGRGRRKA